MADPNFGIAIRKIDDEARPVLAADLSTIGIIGPASEADAATFPLNTPVHVDSNRISTLTKLGSKGYIADAIRGVNEQLGETQFAARCVIIRTAEGTDANDNIRLMQTINNIVGDPLQGTGIFAFLASAAKLGFTPRLIVAPGYTSQMANTIDQITQTNPGTEYVEGHSYPLTVTGGGTNAVQATAHAIGQANGNLGPAVIDTFGAWYDEAATPTVTAPWPHRHCTAAAVVNGGGNYAVDDTITLANGVVVKVLTLTGTAVATVSVQSAGSVFDDPVGAQAQLSTSGNGGAATFNLTWANAGTRATFTSTTALGANPVCATLPSVLNQVLGHAIVESAGSSQDNDQDWRETLDSGRLIPVSGGVKVLDPNTATIVARPLAPRVAGIAVRRDHEKGAPFHSWANQPVYGIIGPMRDIPFSLTDSANEAQELLGFNIGCVVRGELGDDFAIASGGFIFIGTDNAGDDELWRFYNVQRGRDYIHLGLLRALRFFLGRYNIVGHTVQAVLNTMGFFLRDLQADGHILGYRVNFRTDGNSAEEIRLGHLTVGFAAEEPPVLKKLVIESARYRAAIDAMVADLAAQLNLASS